jgi:hypothetical protein
MRHCITCGDRITVTFDICPNCWKQWTITGTQPNPEWLNFLISDTRNFKRKKASTHEIPYSMLGIEDYDEIGGLGGIFSREEPEFDLDN